MFLAKPAKEAYIKRGKSQLLLPVSKFVMKKTLKLMGNFNSVRSIMGAQ